MEDTTQNILPDAPIEGISAYDVIDAILSLPDAEKKKLPALVRTDYDGIKAYQCFLYGACLDNEMKPPDASESTKRKKQVQA